MPYVYTILYKEILHKELRFDKRILEESTANFCAHLLCEFINFCCDMTRGQWKNITKSGTTVSECVRKSFYTHD